MTRRRNLLAVVVLTTTVVFAAPAGAAGEDKLIVLPGATSAEGIAKGRGSTFYAGDLLGGDIFRGDIRKGTAAKFIDVPAGTRMAVGMAVDRGRHLLFVAGGSFGGAYVYDLDTGATAATYAFGAGFVNDVTVTRAGAWFTDSTAARLFFVPRNLGPHRTLALSGPAADTSGQFNNNGIAATPDGKRLIVAHSGNGVLNVVDPRTGTSSTITGVSVPSPDGIIFEAGRMWVVQNFLNQIAEVKVRHDLASGTVVDTVTSPLFQVPTTVARFGSKLAAVNAKFDTGFPPTAPQYEVVVVGR